MKKIDLYIESLYKHMDETSDEVQLLKQEMKNHLVQTVEELKSDGKNEEESIEIAISRFGEGEQIEKELSKVFKIQRKFTKVLLRVATLFLAISMATLMIFELSTINNDRKMAERHTEFQNIAKKLQETDNVPKEEISNLYNKYKNQMRYISIIDLNSTDSPTFVYPSDISIDELKDELYLSKTISTDNHNWEVRYGMHGDSISNSNSFLPIIKLMCIVCFLIYWVVFGIWGIINTYHLNRFSVSWIILFFTLNIVALLIFKIEEMQWLKKFKPHII